MIPVPQYPLYSATLVLNQAVTVGYVLDEEQNWTMHAEELESKYQKHIQAHPDQKVRGLVVINPSNPTGAVISEQTAIEVIEFCARHDITLFADEVY